MSTQAPRVKRHALGLPAGSVRAAHVLGIVALVCTILIIPTPIPIPPYLTYLLFLMLGHYFAAHRVSVDTSEESGSPLYLPGWLVRFLILGALVASVGWQLTHDQARLYDQFERSLDALKHQPFLPLIILGGFFVGIIIRTIMGSNPPELWQDLEAWISLVALVLLAIAGMIHIFIGTSVEGLDMPVWESVVGAVIAFYFGERS